ncbi:hypothetical protein [Bacteroides sp.]
MFRSRCDLSPCAYIVSDCFGFPASGFRQMESGGALANVGTNAYNWASSSYGSSNQWGAFLNLNSTWVNPLNNTNRTHGFPVRCVQAYTE